MIKCLILPLLLILFLGCTKTKSPVEVRFDGYLQANGLSEKLVNVDSIVFMDSTNLYDEVIKCCNMVSAIKDTINSMQEEMLTLTRNDNFLRHLTYSDKLILQYQTRKIILSDDEIGDDFLKANEKLTNLINELPCDETWHSTYAIYATFKDGQKKYYARYFAFEDSYAFAEGLDSCYTPTSKRYIDIITEFYGLVTNEKQRLAKLRKTPFFINAD